MGRHVSVASQRVGRRAEHARAVEGDVAVADDDGRLALVQTELARHRRRVHLRLLQGRVATTTTV